MEQDNWVTLNREELTITGTGNKPKAAGDDAERLLILRPTETYRMSSGILAHPGKEYGA